MQWKHFPCIYASLKRDIQVHVTASLQEKIKKTGFPGQSAYFALILVAQSLCQPSTTARIFGDPLTTNSNGSSVTQSWSFILCWCSTANGIQTPKPHFVPGAKPPQKNKDSDYANHNICWLHISCLFNTESSKNIFLWTFPIMLCRPWELKRGTSAPVVRQSDYLIIVCSFHTTKC